MTDEPAYYSKGTFAQRCKITVRTLDRHIALNTEGIGKVFKYVKNVGWRCPNNGMARNFIELMKARANISRKPKPTPL